MLRGCSAPPAASVHSSGRRSHRALNDACRTTRNGGSLLFTAGVAALPTHTQRQVLLALLRFDRFDAGNDPYGEHDFGAFTVESQRLFFKIDYYDLGGTNHSPDPADPAVTRRVLTVMLADEY